MYNKIYRNMLFLCGTVLSLITLIVLLTYYTSFKNNIKNEFNENAQNIALQLNTTNNQPNLIEKLNENDSGYVYELADVKNTYCDCKEEHYCTSITLDNGSLLHVRRSRSDMFASLYAMLVYILVLGLLIYFLSVRFAAKLTDSIVQPFSDLLSLDEEDTYAEILPLTRAIEFQNAEIKRQTENAQAREVELQLITDNMNEGLVILDKKGDILSVNNFALKVFDADKHTVRKKPFSSLLQNDAFLSAVNKALEGNRSNAHIELGESDYRVYCSPILKNNSPGGVIILLFDITSTYQSEKLRREFSANVSHELKTPLTSINGYAQIISSGIAKQDDIPQFAGKIAKESNRLMFLIEDIIRLSNLDEGAPAEPDTEISIKEIVSDTLGSLQEKANKRNIIVNSEGADFFVNANKTQVSELIYNICDNAIKYNKDSGSVTIRLAEPTLTISDTGIGIPQDYIDRIFERFFRVDKSHSKKVDGTGLGLSIVKHIAKQNNIEIDVKSKLGEGSTFTITFKKPAK